MINAPIIYKYRSWNTPHHQRVLTQNELYFSSPSDINDPFDLKVTSDLSLLDTDFKRAQFIDQMLKDGQKVLAERGIDKEIKRKELLWRLVHEPNQFQDEFDSTNFAWINNRFGVISFSQRWNSILMWSHYSNNHEGFCVGFNRNKMENSKLFDSGGEVTYTDSYPPIDPLENNVIEEIFKKTYTKAFDWKYEKEYRITNIWNGKDPSSDERKIYLPDDFFEEILLGLAISDKDKAEISEIAYSKKIPLFQIKKKRKRFLLEKIPL